METSLISAASLRGVVCHAQPTMEAIQLRLIRPGEVVPLGAGVTFTMSNVNHSGVLVRTRTASFVLPMSVVRRMLEELGSRRGQDGSKKVVTREGPER
jgi:hypothetical protein